MTSPVINVDDAPTFANAPEGSSRFGSVMAPLGKVIGARRLGAMYMQVEPGKRAFPFHNHHANEEMFIVLEGEGTYRFGAAEYPIRAGSVCAAPTGGPETAHEIINTGKVMLKYISISTMIDPEVCEYPDSGKFAAIAIGEGNDFLHAHLKSVHRVKDTLGYFDGEEM
jgi:uncharacterized cupin superfamily protein